MALPAKGSRHITVNGGRYRWVVAPGDEAGMGIVVEAADVTGRRIVTWIDHGTIIAPWLVRETIVHALSKDWEPAARGPDLVFRFDAAAVRVLHAKRVTALCNQALDAVRPVLSHERYEDAHDYINKYGEWGLALEFLIDWICDDEAPITQSQFRCIEKAADAMEMGATDRIRHLRDRVPRS